MYKTSVNAKLKLLVMSVVFVEDINHHIVDCQDPALAAVVALDTPPRNLRSYGCLEIIALAIIDQYATLPTSRSLEIHCK